MGLILLFIQILCASLVIAAGLPNERIVGGDAAQPGQFPYVVSIIENSNTHLCGGFIYSSRWIVTAASCVEGKLPSALRIMTGISDFDSVTGSEQNITVFNIFINDQYNSTFQTNDIALLQLTKNIVFDDTSNTDIIKYNEVDTVNLLGQVIGWGTTTEDETPSRQLRYAFVDIAEFSVYCGDYSVNEFLIYSMICASSSATSDPFAGTACRYDEGSPLVQISNGQHTAVGIMSKTKACSLDSPAIYTRLSVFYYWLINIAGPQ